MTVCPIVDGLRFSLKYHLSLFYEQIIQRRAISGQKGQQYIVYGGDPFGPWHGTHQGEARLAS